MVYRIIYRGESFVITSYGTVNVLAYLVAFFFLCKRAKNSGWREEQAALLSLILVVSGLTIGNKLNNFLFSGKWSSSPSTRGVIIVGAVITVIFYFSGKLKYLDVCAPPSALCYAIAKIGCFMGGCCFGRPAFFGLGVVFPPGSPAFRVFPGKALIPVQLISSIIWFALCGLLLYVEKKKSYDGQLFFFQGILFGLYRFFVGFLRYHNHNDFFSLIGEFGIGKSQIEGIVIFCVFGILMLKKHVDIRNIKE